MVAKFWIKQLLIKPDPSPYLLAARIPSEIRLLANIMDPLYYTNNSQILADTLSGAKD